MRFYATGTVRKKGLDGEVSFVNVVIPLTEESRVGAVNQANRIAKKRKIQLDGVYPERQNREGYGEILTKNMKALKASRNK